MKVSYDPTTDVLSIVLRDDRAVAESDEDKPGVILYTSRRLGLLLPIAGQLPGAEHLAGSRARACRKREARRGRSPGYCSMRRSTKRRMLTPGRAPAEICAPRGSGGSYSTR